MSSAAHHPGNEADLFGDYELLEKIAAGGMGIVYRARHRKLERLVALKVLPTEQFAQASDWLRFRIEAETIAALDHQNIVPIYEVGERDGQLFLSLQLMDGGTLADHLPRYLGEPKAAAALVILIAQAVHHAHQHGVLHRNLKPSNILLDAQGRPYVTDFGLAPQLDPNSGLTRSGTILGTPSYLAPEQTLESPPALATATDVYGLGGILYALLTGGPAFEGDNVFATIAQVRERPARSPARRNPRVSRDLATICLKCLEKNPARRYASAQELADDLGRYLRDEPTLARPIGPARRAARWVRRKPALAVLIAAVGVFIPSFVIALLIHNVELGRAVQQAKQNEKEAEEHQRLAAENYRKARETINKMLARLEGRGLADIPRLHELSKDQIDDALTFYQRALEALDDPGPEVRRDTAIAYHRAANIQQALGRYQAAAENYRRAVELLVALPPDLRDSSDNQRFLSGAHTNLALAAQNTEQWDEAERNHREALAIDERLAAAQPNDSARRAAVAEKEHNMGSLRRLTKKWNVAEWHYLRAVALRSALVSENPGVDSYRAALAGDYVDLGSIYMNTKRAREAEDAYQKAEELLIALAEADSENDDHRLTLAAAYVNWSNLLRSERNSKDALRLLNEAVEFTEAALRRQPNYGFARSQAYSAHATRAQLYEQLDQFAQAVKDWDRVVDLDNNKDGWIRRGLRATALARAGDHARATAQAADLEDKTEVSADGLYHLATVYAVAMQAANADVRLSADDRTKVAESYASRGIGLLARLKAQGYFDDPTHLFKLLRDPNLKQFQNRDDLKKLLTPAGGPMSK